MTTAKKFIYPIAFSLACTLSYFLVFDILLKMFVTAAALVGAIVGVILGFSFILFLCLIAVPCHCFIYSKKFLLDENKKYVFTFYNSLVLALFCFLLVFKEKEAYIYSILLLIWAEIWSVFPLLFHKK